MVAEDEKLDFEQMLLMYKKGHTRIPVCRGRPDNPNAPIVGLMLTKDLIMLDPDDGALAATCAHLVPPPRAAR